MPSFRPDTKRSPPRNAHTMTKRRNIFRNSSGTYYACVWPVGSATHVVMQIYRSPFKTVVDWLCFYSLHARMHSCLSIVRTPQQMKTTKIKTHMWHESKRNLRKGPSTIVMTDMTVMAAAAVMMMMIISISIQQNRDAQIVCICERCIIINNIFLVGVNKEINICAHNNNNDSNDTKTRAAKRREDTAATTATTIARAAIAKTVLE